MSHYVTKLSKSTRDKSNTLLPRKKLRNTLQISAAFRKLTHDNFKNKILN